MSDRWSEDAGPEGEAAPGLVAEGRLALGSSRSSSRYCRSLRASKEAKAGAPLKLRSWQREVIEGLYDPDPRPRQGLVSISRKNGKTLLAACLALYHLVGDGEASAEVLVVSSDERTRGHLQPAPRMVELERLAAVIEVHESSLRQAFPTPSWRCWRRDEGHRDAISTWPSSTRATSPPPTAGDALGQATWITPTPHVPGSGVNVQAAGRNSRNGTGAAVTSASWA
jgi:hypothetical protein